MPSNPPNLTVIRQTRCADTPEGHRFPNGHDGVCPRCGLTINPRLRLVSDAK